MGNNEFLVLKRCKKLSTDVKHFSPRSSKSVSYSCNLKMSTPELRDLFFRYNNPEQHTGFAATIFDSQIQFLIYATCKNLNTCHKPDLHFVFPNFL